MASIAGSPVTNREAIRRLPVNAGDCWAVSCLHHNNTEAIRGVVTRYFGTGEAADKAECVLILLIAERALHTSVKKTRTNGFEGAPRPSATGCATKPFTTTLTSPRRRPTVMADYYNFQQVVQMCGIAESTLA